jgi:hypothetical protein
VDYWAVRRPVIYSLCVGGLWGILCGLIARVMSDTPLISFVAFVLVGLVGFGPVVKRRTVRNLRKWEKANTVSTSA